MYEVEAVLQRRMALRSPRLLLVGGGAKEFVCFVCVRVCVLCVLCVFCVCVCVFVWLRGKFSLNYGNYQTGGQKTTP
jgi:hypothetical protein